MSVLIRATLRMGNLLGVVRPCAGVPAPFVLVRAVCGSTAGSGPDCWNGTTNCALHPAASSSKRASSGKSSCSFDVGVCMGEAAGRASEGCWPSEPLGWPLSGGSCVWSIVQCLLHFPGTSSCDRSMDVSRSCELRHRALVLPGARELASSPHASPQVYLI